VRIFQVALKSNKDLCIYMGLGKTRNTYFEKFENSEGVGTITDETFSLWIATSWRVARDYA